MGQEEERERRLRDLAGYGITSELLAQAGNGAIVLHCLPAHYGEEITEEVLYGPQSAVWDQAENRLHAQKALMALVISREAGAACSRSRTTSRRSRSQS